MSAKNKNRESPVEITDEIQSLLSRFTAEEIDTGIIRTAHPPATGSHSAQDISDALQEAILEETVGGLVRAMRHSHDHSLQDAAQNLGVTRGRVHQLEQTDANLRLDTLQRVASAYGYQVHVTLVPNDNSKRLIAAELLDINTGR